MSTHRWALERAVQWLALIGTETPSRHVGPRRLSETERKRVRCVLDALGAAQERLRQVERRETELACAVRAVVLAAEPQMTAPEIRRIVEALCAALTAHAATP